MYTFPDFIIAGSAKAGTTALHLMLDQHPNVYMSQVKETNYFVHAYEPTRQLVDHRGARVLECQRDYDIIDNVVKYQGVFAGAEPSQILGEASPLYLINEAVPKRVWDHRSDIKIVIILRNPSDVAFANFVHHLRVGAESLKLEDADEIFSPAHYERPDLYPFCHHLDLPRYSTHLPGWLTCFDRSNLHLMIYEEFNADRRRALSHLHEFLQLSDNAEIAVDTRVNVSGLARSECARDLLQGSVAFKKLIGLIVPAKPRRRIRAMLESFNTTTRIAMPPVVRKRFDELYEPDVTYVEQILGRRMTAWRKLRSEEG